MAPHSSTLAWKIPWSEEHGELQSMGSLRVGHDWATPFHFSVSCIGEGNGNPVQCSCLENPRHRGAWWAAVYGVAQSSTRLMQLSSSSKPTFSLSSFTFIKRLSSSSFSARRWCHLHIWCYWHFSWQSGFQLVLHPAWHFIWGTLHIS